MRSQCRQHGQKRDSPIQQAIRLPKTETTWRALLKDGDLMAESNDLSLLSGTGPKRGSDQSQKGDEKWTHRGNHDDLTNGAKTCIFNPDGVFCIHRSRRLDTLRAGGRTLSVAVGDYFWQQNSG